MKDTLKNISELWGQRELKDAELREKTAEATNAQANQVKIEEQIQQKSIQSTITNFKVKTEVLDKLPNKLNTDNNLISVYSQVKNDLFQELSINQDVVDTQGRISIDKQQLLEAWLTNSSTLCRAQ